VAKSLLRWWGSAPASIKASMHAPAPFPAKAANPIAVFPCFDSVDGLAPCSKAARRAARFAARAAASIAASAQLHCGGRSSLTTFFFLIINLSLSPR
jgi:hypothetical protein